MSEIDDLKAALARIVATNAMLRARVVELTMKSGIQGVKFTALRYAMVTFGFPVLMTFAMVLLHEATKDDLVKVTLWMGAALSPIFMSVILGRAIEGLRAPPVPTVPIEETPASKAPTEEA